MQKVKNIVVPVDFSDNTEKLVDYAFEMGQELSATLHFVHAVALHPDAAIMFGMPYFADYQSTFESNAQGKMTSLIESLQEKSPGCKGEVVMGEPVDTIVEYAKSEKADLIIISTHGAKGLEKILLGSVAERVVQRAFCPVLVLNPFRNAG